MSDWDRVGEIKKLLGDLKIASNENIQKIRIEIGKFHKLHPEFLTTLSDARKK
jgi:hypothetical protein